MTVEIALLLSIVSVSFGVWQGMKNMNRDNIRDEHDNATELATIAGDLKHIIKGIDDIKDEMKNMKKDIRDDHDRLIELEASVKSAHKRLDTLISTNSLNILDRHNSPTEN